MFGFSYFKPYVEELRNGFITLGQLDRELTPELKKLISPEDKVLKISSGKTIQLLAYLIHLLKIRWMTHNVCYLKKKIYPSEEISSVHTSKEYLKN